jgi:hypothetical protein
MYFKNSILVNPNSYKDIDNGILQAHKNSNNIFVYIILLNKFSSIILSKYY